MCFVPGIFRGKSQTTDESIFGNVDSVSIFVNFRDDKNNVNGPPYQKEAKREEFKYAEYDSPSVETVDTQWPEEDSKQKGYEPVFFRVQFLNLL
jgi:hypothetical protein